MGAAPQCGLGWGRAEGKPSTDVEDIMNNSPTPWEVRLTWMLSVVDWGGFALGLSVSAARSGATPEVGLAALIAGAFVVWLEATPLRLRRHVWWGQVITVGGVGASMVAAGLTGGLESGYLLLTISPVLLASAFLGTRVGVQAALLSAGTLIAVAVFIGQDPLSGATLVFGAIYLILGLAFSQARRMLIEERQRTADAERAVGGQRRLIAAHRLLERLAELTESANLSMHDVARETVRAVRGNLPDAGVAITLKGEDGTTTLAVEGRRYQEHKEEFPIQVGQRSLGRVGVSTSQPLDEETRRTVAAAVEPAAVAFDSIRLLRTIATRAIHEERVRLARELHDHIGPELASLGLALDVVIQRSGDPGLVTDLSDLRNGIENLVEQIRAAVADLRSEPGPTLSGRLRMLADEIPVGGPELLVDVEERRPPRPSIISDVRGILVEAVRNAIQHADATVITVRGRIDRERGEISVADDGTGFAASSRRSGHYGLVGMEERAARAGALLDVVSHPGTGTSVVVQWGPD